MVFFFQTSGTGSGQDSPFGQRGGPMGRGDSMGRNDMSGGDRGGRFGGSRPGNMGGRGNDDAKPSWQSREPKQVITIKYILKCLFT